MALRVTLAVALMALAVVAVGVINAVRDDGPPPRANGPGAAVDQPRHRLPGRELMRADFETGDLSQWDDVYAVADDRVQVVTDPVDQGRYAGRFEVRDGDNPIGYGDRAMVALNTAEHEGDARWYEWSTLFPRDFPRLPEWQVVTQWHSTEDGSPPIGFYVEEDSLVLQVNRFAAPGEPIDTLKIWRGPLRRGEWRNLKLRVDWSGSDARGSVELWVDGTRQRFDDGSLRRRIRTMYPGYDNYWQMGYYRRAGRRPTGVVYHDAFRTSVAAPARSAA
jgi:Polysaccharide lyase